MWRLCAVALVLPVLGCGLTGGQPAGRDEATVAFSAQPDVLDPAVAYSIEAAAVISNVYLPPLTYRRVDGRRGTELVPALARALPARSHHGLRYSFRLRPGTRYSDGRAVRASDIERAIKRTLYLGSPGSKYFVDIPGARRYRAARHPQADIRGVATDDRTGAVRITLRHHNGTFPYALASSFAAPVPPGTPFKRLGEHLPPATGAFEIESVHTGRQIVLARNDRMPGYPGVPTARLDRVTIRIVRDRRLQAERVIRGDLDYMFDPLPVDMLGRIRHDYPDRYSEFTTNSTLYFWLNSSVPPFDNARLRRAVHLGLDKVALARVYGGLLTPTCNFLPPGMPGYRRLDPCPFGDPRSGGDVAAARRIVKREGALGTPVKVWGPDLEPNREATEAFADQLHAMGFKPDLKLLSVSVYFQVIGDARPVFQAGFGDWLQEFPHPASFFAAVRGDAIGDHPNYNWSRTDVPSLTSAIKRLQRRPRLTQVVRARWAALDRRVVEDAGVIPYGHSRWSVFTSDRMSSDGCAPRHLVYITDFSRFCVR